MNCSQNKRKQRLVWNEFKIWTLRRKVFQRRPLKNQSFYAFAIISLISQEFWLVFREFAALFSSSVLLKLDTVACYWNPRIFELNIRQVTPTRNFKFITRASSFLSLKSISKKLADCWFTEWPPNSILSSSRKIKAQGPMAKPVIMCHVSAFFIKFMYCASLKHTIHECGFNCTEFDEAQILIRWVESEN